ALIDEVFLQGMPRHVMDTIPGNHGGINELGSSKHESADVILHSAVTFLTAMGTKFTTQAHQSGGKSDKELLDLYPDIMVKFQGYKKQGSRLNNLAFCLVGGVRKHDRKVNTRIPNANSHLDKNNYQGQLMQGIPGFSHLRTGGCRFFANQDHKVLF